VEAQSNILPATPSSAFLLGDFRLTILGKSFSVAMFVFCRPVSEDEVAAILAGAAKNPVIFC
jgi:FAD/FMN-containing dehydrogenase